MEAAFLGLFGDPQLLEIAFCLGLIGVLRWIATVGREQTWDR